MSGSRIVCRLNVNLLLFCHAAVVAVIVCVCVCVCVCVTSRSFVGTTMNQAGFGI